jgi:hypothetical protein
MTIAASLLLSVSLALRVYNPHQQPVDAIVDCAGVPRAVHVEANDIADLTACAMATIDSPLPLVAFETTLDEGVETQRLLDTGAACEPFAVEAPLFGCRNGMAAVAVPLVPGAAYAWSVEGASVVSGHGTNRLVLNLGQGSSARVSATITGECTGTSQAVISLRDPLLIETFQVPAEATANTETTIQWSYANGLSPASQLLSGEAFDAPVPLGGDVRSYKWTPKTTGSKSVELRASYSPAISLTPPKRRRAMGSSRAIATECPSAVATKQMDVGGCGVLNTSIDAPENVEVGSTFTAAIFLRTGETVQWTIDGGTILSGQTSSTVTAKAGDTPGSVHLFAKVTAGPNCHETSQARVAVIERAVCNSAAPSVALSVEKVNCDSATIKATFTGTPPFSGMWSDNAPFTTSATTLTHDFKHVATYSIRNFRDSLCAGDVSQTARVTSFGPSATVTMVGGTCMPGGKAVAAFTGTPPFIGKWYWGEWFSTNEHSIESNEFDGGVAQIEIIRDAQCPNALNASNAIQLENRPTARLRETSFCTTNNAPYATLWVDISQIEGAKPPFTVYWSDGEVTTGGKNSYSMFRSVNTSHEETVSVVRVAGKTCDAILDPDRTTARITFHELPTVDYFQSDFVTCIGKTATFRLKPGYHPDAQVHWSVSNGEILSGQGTNEITVLQTRLPAATITLETTFPDASCITYPSRYDTYLVRPLAIRDFSVTPAVIPPGGTAEIHFDITEQEWVSLEASPATRDRDLHFSEAVCTTSGCTVPYRDTRGAGIVGIALYTGNDCGTEARVVTLVIQAN